jgi:hypothetical protein
MERTALRTNLLYNALLLPTLGAEWRINDCWGIKTDVNVARWSNNNGSVQKMWLISPEIRHYSGTGKRFYLGAGRNIGKVNVNEFPLGKALNALYTDNTGYQGEFWNAGLTAGYQLPLSRRFALDFNIGAGYNAFEYDTFTIINGMRVYRGQNHTKNVWGVTQAGVSLIFNLTPNPNPSPKERRAGR